MVDFAAMKKETPLAATLYKEKKPQRRRSVLSFILLLFVFLLSIHFLNLFLQWTTIRLELAQGPVYQSPEYTFLGFSLFNQKKIAAIRYFKNSSKPVMIFSFFDFFHPAIFAIWNKNEMNFVDLGQIVIDVPAGFSRVSFLPSSIFVVEHENKSAAKYYGASPLGLLWHGSLTKKYDDSEKPLAVSLVIKELEKSRYLKLPYLIYFYLPLLIIVLLAIRYGSVMLMAFFYYAEICFLFDYRKMFVTIPFDWLFKLSAWEISDGIIEALAALIITAFVIGAVFGLWRWKKHSLSNREKGIILFFILLPFFLFF